MDLGRQKYSRQTFSGREFGFRFRPEKIWRAFSRYRIITGKKNLWNPDIVISLNFFLGPKPDIVDYHFYTYQAVQVRRRVLIISNLAHCYYLELA